MERPRVNFEVWPEAIELGHLFAARGYELALVGGPVRDLLLHRRSHDLDFCTSAHPDEFEPILRHWGRDGFWDMGRKFGTLGAMRRREDGTEVKVEITTYRSDTYDPESRKPEVSYGDSLEGDLSRRDFTVNAMALRVPQLEFVDPFGGASDLAKGVLRTPVDPYQSFDDDPLRMMRAVRFVAQLGFSIAPDTAAAISDMTDRIDIVSAERVRDELTKLLLSDRPRAGVEALVESGLADIVFPEIPALQLEIDEHHRHKDVFEHTMIVLDRAIALETGPEGPVPAPDLTLRLAALTHDIGKPKTRRFEPGGKVSFHHHDAVGAKMTRKRLKALRFDHHLVEDVSELVNLHLRFHGYVEEPWTDSAVRRYVKDAGPLYERLNRRYTQQTSAAVVAEMVQREYINDARYAETRAHALLAAKKSRRAAAQNLRQKGLAAGEIQQALDAVYTPDVSGEDPELEAAAALVEGHYRKKLEAGRRDLVIAALQRRGFSYSVIKEAIRRVEEGE